MWLSFDFFQLDDFDIDSQFGFAEFQKIPNVVMGQIGPERLCDAGDTLWI